jgi:hypothetical protein
MFSVCSDYRRRRVRLKSDDHVQDPVDNASLGRSTRLAS